MLALGGCGETGRERGPAPAPAPRLFGPGERYRPAPNGVRARRALPIGRMRCGRPTDDRFLIHVETFVNGRVVLMPAGIGIAPPHRRRGAFVAGGRCEYPIRTREPTGLVEVAHGTHPSLGDLFAVWGQPLTRTRALSFRGRVTAFVGRRRVGGDPRRIALSRHAAITLEIGRQVPPHARYAFPPGPPAVRP